MTRIINKTCRTCKGEIAINKDCRTPWKDFEKSGHCSKKCEEKWEKAYDLYVCQGQCSCHISAPCSACENNNNEYE